ncbi:hypothetical protein ACFFJT_10845 [Dyella flava]|uniref:DUF7661 domain-containing protein n=1 Tax=Dyella flava TaxID=1920170 RepID=A0ABS2JY63_9GAMM|nr:hypothetical protein [Dyella flava]MBM7123937.1 hypothetical protein [Dyella flava]GLQ52536.1 hypothetical protein GCM10010872_39850 [Dyella flava]
MRFNVYGRFLLDIKREGGAWVIYRIADGKRVLSNDFVIPSDLEEAEIPQFLDDVFHELSGPDDRVDVVP